LDTGKISLEITAQTRRPTFDPKAAARLTILDIGGKVLFIKRTKRGVFTFRTRLAAMTKHRRHLKNAPQRQ